MPVLTPTEHKKRFGLQSLDEVVITEPTTTNEEELIEVEEEEEEEPVIELEIEEEEEELTLHHLPGKHTQKAHGKGGKTLKGGVGQNPYTAKLDTSEEVTQFVAATVSTKFTANQLVKMGQMNPKIVPGDTSVFKVPKALNDEQIKALEKILPVGTKIKKVSASAELKKKGLNTVTGKGETKSTAAPIAKSAPVSKSTSIAKKTTDPFTGTTGLELGGESAVSASLKASTRSWEKTIEPSQMAALTAWADGQYRQMRKRIASGNPSASDKKLLATLENAPKFEGTVYRGFKSQGAGKEILAQVRATGVGGVWSDKSPHSTSRSPSVATGFSGNGMLMAIRSKTGRRIETVSSHKSEKEIVGMPGAKYKITKLVENVRVNGSKQALYVELEEI
jgi:hypothetical protein